MSHFYVANELWAGGLNGFYASGAGDQTEKWRSTDAIFEFVKYLGNGWFLYDFTGTVAWRDSGSGGGCTWNGSGTREFGPGAAKAAGTGLSVDYEDRVYYGHSDVDSSSTGSESSAAGAAAVPPPRSFPSFGTPRNPTGIRGRSRSGPSVSRATTSSRGEV
jgi:hypothetical protein